MRRRFFTLDVFTDTPLLGNPLAVVMESDGLDADRMQAIAREFNLSETVFVLPPHDPVNTARVRIFTPGRELPFAGHPTIGTAIVLAEQRAPELLGRQDLSIVLEEEVGAVQCIVRRLGGRTRASFTLPRLPEPVGVPLGDLDLAAALSVEPAAIGFADHRPVVMSAGTPFTLVPLASPAVVDRARPEPARWPEKLAAFIYAKVDDAPGPVFHARMFAPSFGIREDPATGSAVAAFAGILRRSEHLLDGDHTVTVRQGYAMGRPSLDHARARIGGRHAGLGVDRRRGCDGERRNDRPVIAPVEIVEVAAIDCAFEPRPWAFAADRAAEIETHWQDQVRLKT